MDLFGDWIATAAAYWLRFTAPPGFLARWLRPPVRANELSGLVVVHHSPQPLPRVDIAARQDGHDDLVPVAWEAPAHS